MNKTVKIFTGTASYWILLKDFQNSLAALLCETAV
jgi:hypothetical protein